VCQKESSLNKKIIRHKWGREGSGGAERRIKNYSTSTLNSMKLTTQHSLSKASIKYWHVAWYNDST